MTLENSVAYNIAEMLSDEFTDIVFKENVFIIKKPSLDNMQKSDFNVTILNIRSVRKKSNKFGIDPAALQIIVRSKDAKVGWDSIDKISKHIHAFTGEYNGVTYIDIIVPHEPVDLSVDENNNYQFAITVECMVSLPQSQSGRRRSLQ